MATLPGTRIPRSLLASTAGLLLLAGAPLAQGPCFDLSPNDVYEDGYYSDGNVEMAVRVTNGAQPITLQYVETFTGESTGTGRMSIRAYDPSLGHPGAVLGSGSWRLLEENGWQGAVLDTPVTIAANQRFWITQWIDDSHQSPIESVLGAGNGPVMMHSRDGGQNWSGPFQRYQYKFRGFCYVPAHMSRFGSGCGGSTGAPTPLHFFETFVAPANPFDLGTGARFTPTGGGWDVTASQGPLDPNHGPALPLGNDSLSYGHALGFDFPVGDGRTTDTIDIDSNGSILLFSDPTNVSQCDLTVSEFGANESRILPYHTHLLPSAGGSIHFNTVPGRAVITWLNIRDADFERPNTFQLQLFDDGSFQTRYGQLTAEYASVGYSLASDPGLTANDIDDPQRPAIHLGVDARPVLGTTINVSTFDLAPTTTVAALGLGFLAFEPGLDLSVIGMLRCQQLTRADILIPAVIQGTTATAQIPVPNDPALVALRAYVQAHAVVPGANPLNLVLSDGYRLILGL